LSSSEEHLVIEVIEEHLVIEVIEEHSIIEVIERITLQLFIGESSKE
jgi:hypothetical protein